jgi:hypothetical protein
LVALASCPAEEAGATRARDAEGLGVWQVGRNRFCQAIGLEAMHHPQKRRQAAALQNELRRREAYLK